MFSVFVNAWKVKEIRNKLIYILIMLLIYRVGSVILIPGLDYATLLAAQNMDAGNILAQLTGGSYGTVFYMGIGPYITASIIMQLLTVAIPRLEEMKKEGESGTKKINQLTRIVAVGLSVIQGTATVYSLRNIFTHPNLLTYIMAVVTLVTGTIFIMWLAELLTEKGIGNGSSFIIFANILSGLPRNIMMVMSGALGTTDVWKWATVILIGIIFVAILAFAVRVQAGERRIPIHYAKNVAGRSKFGIGSNQFIPFKVNIAGVMSIIFAISLLQFPQVIQSFVSGGEFLNTVVTWLSTKHPFGAALYVILIFCFTFFYTSFSINPVEMAQNLKNSQGIIPGIRQGKPTSDYIKSIIGRLSWIGAFYYAILAMIPIVLEWVFKVPVGFGGTTLLIITGVALELMKQLETQLIQRHYKGFLET